jgi:serine kinase of HPr protein (carbohydrate metabolism regulator)
VALCGPSASGKSTLAAVLAERGCAVLADDLCLIDARDGEPVSVLPGCPRLRLWADSLERLKSPALTRALTGREAYFFDCDGPVPRERLALGALVVLFRRDNGRVEFERLRGALAVDTLYGMVHTRRPAGALGRGHDIFAAVTRLASAGAPIWALRFPGELFCLGETAAHVLTATGG